MCYWGPVPVFLTSTFLIPATEPESHPVYLEQIADQVRDEGVMPAKTLGYRLLKVSVPVYDDEIHTPCQTVKTLILLI